TRSCKLSPRCEATSDERSAGNLHATFCGSRGAGNRPRPPGGQPAMAVPTAIDSNASKFVESGGLQVQVNVSNFDQPSETLNGRLNASGKPNALGCDP
ncbi:MAG: hypothetical protein WAN76_28310, partial [Candidatus Sulfotelmatobacter sp.]